MRLLLRFVLVIVASAALVAGTFTFVAPYAGDVVHANRSEDEDIDLNQLDSFAVRSYIYASDGSLLATLHGAENRSPVSLDRVPEPVVKSILAVEDADFYNHGGVNLRATFRALLENVSAGGIEQGGSTITQQLVKKSYLTDQQSFDRKSQDAAMAIRLEQKLAKVAEAQGAPDPVKVAKDKVLEKYLNTVYFGSGAYGVQAAAETYWGKDVSELSWAEGALLAGLISNPTLYDPYLHPESAKKRRQQSLDRLQHLDWISAADARTYAGVPLPVNRCQINNSDSKAACGNLQVPDKQGYFAEEVKQQLLNDPSFGLGKTYDERYNEVFGGGLKVYTTLNPAAQAVGEQVVRDDTPANDIGVVGALVSVEPSTGAVRAMVGGPGFDKFEYNLATHQPGRQTGSSFKVFVLLTAIEQGNIPEDSIEGGGAFPNKGGTPDPYKIDGPGGTLMSVTLASSNGAYVRLGQTVGLDNVIDTAKRLGVSSDLIPVISLPLGVRETTPIEMASAYASIPNGGIYQPYYLIDRIEDRNGKVVYSHVPNGSRALSQQTACLATRILNENTKSGTGTRAHLSKQDAAGKTGTTEDHSDAWFVGYTPYLATAVWMGNPKERVPMYSLGGKANFGGTYPAQIWHDFNEAYHSGLQPLPFPRCAPTRSPRHVSGLGDTRRLPAGPTGPTNGNGNGTNGNGNGTAGGGGGGGGGGKATTTTAPKADAPAGGGGAGGGGGGGEAPPPTTAAPPAGGGDPGGGGGAPPTTTGGAGGT